MGLTRIGLRDFAIVRELELDLDNGFSVLTGETGAGKSILIDALQLALGARGESSIIRDGATRAEVSAEFDLSPPVTRWLEETGFSADDGAVLIRRTLEVGGRSRSWINGGSATVGQLRELGDRLVDIHGQHAWQSLTRPESVRTLLDAYAGVKPQPLQAVWAAWTQARGAVAQAEAAQATLQRDRDRLVWQIADLDKLAPSSGEWEELDTQHTRLANAQSLIDAAQDAVDRLEDESHGAVPQLARAFSALQDQARLEPQFGDILDVLGSSQAQLEDAAHTLHAYLGRTDLDPGGLAELDERMSSWMSLARRHKRPPSDLHTLLREWKSELAQLEATTDLGALRDAETAAQQSFAQAAREVSIVRAKAAPKLARSVTEAMQGLGMQGGRFEVALEKLVKPGPQGNEDVVFLVAGHAGATPRPIGKVASGGELSRIALAISVTTSQLGDAQTLIFDEVDSGVGGAVAETVGRLMRRLGRDRQVLAVTHLPQVAAYADHHLVVRKEGGSQGVTSSVGAVIGERRVGEIARMLGGERLSDTTLAHAKEMLSVGGTG